jgi:phage baseplate assembly protein gpV
VQLAPINTVDGWARRQGGDEVVSKRFTEGACAVLVKAKDVTAESNTTVADLSSAVLTQLSAAA